MQLDRDVIAKLKVLSREARARGTPHLNVLMSCDGANQCNFVTPAFATRAHGIDDRWVLAFFPRTCIIDREVVCFASSRGVRGSKYCWNLTVTLLVVHCWGMGGR